jgi:hypothetical protein
MRHKRVSSGGADGKIVAVRLEVEQDSGTLIDAAGNPFKAPAEFWPQRPFAFELRRLSVSGGRALEIICGDISEFESDHLSHAVWSPRANMRMPAWYFACGYQASRFTGGASGFLNFSQSFDRPER